MKNVSFLFKSICCTFCFLFLFIYFIVPTNVYAEQVSSTFSGNYYAYTQEARIPNSLPSSYSSNLNQDDAFPNYTDNVLLIAQSNGVWYGMKRIALVNTNFQFKNGVSYTIRLDFQFLFQDNYLQAIDSVERSYTLYNTASDNNFSCTNALCNVSYAKSNGYYITTINFVPTSNFTGTTIVLGSFDTGKVLFANHSGRNMVMNIRSSTITYFNDASNGDIINNNNQNTQQIINNNNENTDKINNNLKDEYYDKNRQDTIIDSLEDGWSEPSTLVQMVQAPINFVNSLVTANSSCQPISLTAFNHSFSIPCGTTLFWNRQDVSTFKLFWNTLFGGLIIYRVALKLFKVVNDAIDPTKDSIEGVEI